MAIEMPKILFLTHVCQEVEEGRWAYYKNIFAGWGSENEDYIATPGRVWPYDAYDYEALHKDSFMFYAWRTGWPWNRRWDAILKRGDDLIRMDQDHKDIVAILYQRCLEQQKIREDEAEKAEEARLERRRWWP